MIERRREGLELADYCVAPGAAEAEALTQAARLTELPARRPKT